MLKLILCILLIPVFFLTTVAVCYFFCIKEKFCIYDLAINEQESDTVSSLKKLIGHFLQDDLILIIIQDDIKFLAPHFYWPTRTAYIHLSDARKFVQLHSNKKEKYSHEEITQFISNHVFIY